VTARPPSTEDSVQWRVVQQYDLPFWHTQRAHGIVIEKQGFRSYRC
jgi:hypothetical protein